MMLMLIINQDDEDANHNKADDRAFIFFIHVYCLQGVLSSRGRKILMVDADGASKFADLDKLDDMLNDIQKTKV